MNGQTVERSIERLFWIWVLAWIVVGEAVGVSASPNYTAFGKGIDLMKDLIALGAAACVAVAMAKGVELARSRGNEGWGGFLKAFIVAVAMTSVTLAGGIPSLGIAGADTSGPMHHVAEAER